MEPLHHTVFIDGEKCSGRMRCLRVCPTEAIRIRNGKALILEDRCIDCGECSKVCPTGAISVEVQSLLDLPPGTVKVALVSPVLYSQFPKEMTPARIHLGLKKLGFDEVCAVADYCEMVGLAIQEYLDERRGPRPAVSSFCPTVLRLIQVRYPELVEEVIPLEPPREIAAREARQQLVRERGLPPEKVKTVYLTPCPARMLQIKERHSPVDQAIPIKDIYRPLLNAVMSHEVGRAPEEETAISQVGVSWARLGGISRALASENWIEVAGLANVIRLFDDLEQGKLRDVDFMECFACQEGCIGGSLNVENLYVARSRNIRLSNRGRREPLVSRERIRELYREGYFQRSRVLEPRPLAPLNGNLGRAILKMKEKEKLLLRLPGIDCGACGCPTCSAFAEDAVKGEAPRDGCTVKRGNPLSAKSGKKGAQRAPVPKEANR